MSREDLVHRIKILTDERDEQTKQMRHQNEEIIRL